MRLQWELEVEKEDRRESCKCQSIRSPVGMHCNQGAASIGLLNSADVLQSCVFELVVDGGEERSRTRAPPGKPFLGPA